MRNVIGRGAAAMLLVSATAASAGSKTTTETGRLGQVSSGIDKATSHPSSSSSSSTTQARDHRTQDTTDTVVFVEPATCYPCESSGPPVAGGMPSLPPLHLGLEGFAGAQKVVESSGSLSLELGLTIQRRARLDAAVSHYFEDEMDGSRITMTMPSIAFGLRLGTFAATQLWLEGGIAHVRTHDPAGSSAMTGSLVLGRLEHAVSRDTALVATGGAMLFDGVQAFTARAGIRSHHVEAAFRVLDFSVGPALYGPEIGVAF